MAGNTEERLQRIERDETRRASAASRPIMFVGLLLAAGLGGILYVANRQEQKEIVANGGIALPEVLLTKPSAARRDLALLDRDLHELAREADTKLSKHPGPGNKKHGEIYLARLKSFHKTGRELEPRLTREETRVLMATEHAEILIEGFIRASFDERAFDRTLIEKAEKQVSRAQALARGEQLDAIEPGAKTKALFDVAAQFKNLGANLETIKKMRGSEQVEEGALYVPEIDGPVKPKPHHKKSEQ